jgi:hypothetical protein
MLDMNPYRVYDLQMFAPIPQAALTALIVSFDVQKFLTLMLPQSVYFCLRC